MTALKVKSLVVSKKQLVIAATPVYNPAVSFTIAEDYMILDRKAALDLIDDDEELFDELCEIFRREAPELLDKLQKAIDVGEIQVAVRFAHSLKSASANLGATKLREVVSQAEQAGNGGDIQEMLRLLPLITTQLNMVLAEIA